MDSGNSSWIDAHSHLTEEQLISSKDSGIQAWILGGIEPEEWKRQLALQNKWPGRVYPTFGLHPWWLHTATWEMFWEAYAELEKEIPKATALGETGLDAYKERAGSLPLQLEAFKCQIELAKKAGKPLVLHIVQAHAQARDFLREGGEGILHSFSGSEDDAKYYTDRGFLISVSGSILKPGYKGLKQAVLALPLEKIVLETDSGHPLELLKIAETVGGMKGKAKEEILATSTANVKRVFKI